MALAVHPAFGPATRHRGAVVPRVVVSRRFHIGRGRGGSGCSVLIVIDIIIVLEVALGRDVVWGWRREVAVGPPLLTRWGTATTSFVTHRRGGLGRRGGTTHNNVRFLELTRVEGPDIGHVVDVEAVVLQLLRDVGPALVKLCVIQFVGEPVICGDVTHGWSLQNT